MKNLAWTAKIPDAIWAPVLEALLVLLAGVISLAFGQIWLFSSLGPTAFEVAEHPKRPSSRPRAIIIGHFTAIAIAFGSVAVFGAWNAPLANPQHGLPLARLWASAAAALLTAAVNLLLGTNQPASLATALLITLGSFQSGYGALGMIAGVMLIAGLGIPLRKLGILRRNAGAPIPTKPALAA